MRSLQLIQASDLGYADMMFCCRPSHSFFRCIFFCAPPPSRGTTHQDQWSVSYSTDGSGTGASGEFFMAMELDIHNPVKWLHVRKAIVNHPQFFHSGWYKPSIGWFIIAFQRMSYCDQDPLATAGAVRVGGSKILESPPGSSPLALSWFLIWDT